MTSRLLPCLLLALFACTPAASASADDTSESVPAAGVRRGADFSWSGTLRSGGEVRLANVSGDVAVVAGKGDAVKVRAKISGRDAKIAKVVVDDAGGDVEIRADLGRERDTSVRIDYTIEVPASARFHADVVSGDIEVKDVQGALTLETVSGDVRASGSGDVEVRTVEGDAALSLPAGTSRAMLEAVNGTLEVAVPASLGLDLRAKSLGGRIRADVEHERLEQMVGEEVRISRGDRAATVRLETVNGGIRIRKG